MADPNLGRWECPVCHRTLLGPDEACSGSFTEQEHPIGVRAVRDRNEHLAEEPRREDSGADLPEGVERYEPEVVSRAPDAKRMVPTPVGSYVRLADLPKIEQAVVERIREGLLSDGEAAWAMAKRRHEAQRKLGNEQHYWAELGFPHRAALSAVSQSDLEAALATLDQQEGDRG